MTMVRSYKVSNIAAERHARSGQDSVSLCRLFGIILPAGGVASIASVRLRNPAPESASRSIMVSTSRRERDNRSSFHTTKHVGNHGVAVGEHR